MDKIMLRSYYCLIVVWILCAFFEYHPAYTYKVHALQPKQRARNGQVRFWSAARWFVRRSSRSHNERRQRVTECPHCYKAQPRQQRRQLGMSIWSACANPVSRILT